LHRVKYIRSRGWFLLFHYQIDWRETEYERLEWITQFASGKYVWITDEIWAMPFISHLRALQFPHKYEVGVQGMCNSLFIRFKYVCELVMNESAVIIQNFGVQHLMFRVVMVMKRKESRSGQLLIHMLAIAHRPTFGKWFLVITPSCSGLKKDCNKPLFYSKNWKINRRIIGFKQFFHFSFCSLNISSIKSLNKFLNILLNISSINRNNFLFHKSKASIISLNFY
jgi:hypothetical protein